MMVKVMMQLSSVYNEDILGDYGKTMLHCLGLHHVLQGILASWPITAKDQVM